VKISKKLAYLLRHETRACPKGGHYGASIEYVLSSIRHIADVSVTTLMERLGTLDKARYQALMVNGQATRIRALDGHTLPTEITKLEYKRLVLGTPSPGELEAGREAIHLTYSEALASILRGGLIPMQRAVHLAPFTGEPPTHLRQGADVGILVSVKEMLLDGIKLYMSPSQTIMCYEVVDPKYIIYARMVNSGKFVYKRPMPASKTQQDVTASSTSQEVAGGGDTQGGSALCGAAAAVPKNLPAK